MKCDRCYEIIKEPDMHGWMICEYLSRVNPNEPVAGKWTRATNRDRDHYSDDLIQPLKNGKVNERFIKAHGTKELQKQWKMSDREIRENAK